MNVRNTLFLRKHILFVWVNHRGMSKKGGGIPDRWLDYHPLGQRVAGTRFIAFKVPLKEALCRNLGYQDRFTPRSLMEQVPELGLILDLTFTTRYYFHQDFERQGIAYQKFLCPGHVIPPKDLVHRFYTIVDQYIKQNPNSGSLVGVHCTHGLNRTSFFICSYMVERMGISPQDALTAFQKARGYNVERENYIQELLTLKPFSAPPLDELEALYSTQQQPSFNRKKPLPCEISQPQPYEISHKKKKLKQQMDNKLQKSFSTFEEPVNTVQGPVPTNYYNSHQYNSHYQRYQRDFKSESSEGSNFRGEGSNFRDEGSNFRDRGSNFRDRGSNCRGRGSNFRDEGSNFRYEGSIFIGDNSKFRGECLKFRGEGSKFRGGECSNVGGQGSNFRGEGSNVEGEGSNVGGESSNFRGRGLNLRGRGLNLRGRGSNFKDESSKFGGEGSRFSGDGSKFRGEGLKFRGGECSNVGGQGSNFRGEGSNVGGEGSNVGGEGSNFRGEGLNASNGRQRKRYSRFSGGAKQDQITPDQICDNVSGNKRNVTDYSTGIQGRELNNFCGGSQEVITNATCDVRDRQMTSVNKYRNFGKEALVLNRDNNINDGSRNYGSYSRDNGRGRTQNNSDRGRSVNTMKNRNNASETSCGTENPTSREVPRHRPNLDSTAQGHQSRKRYRSSNLPS